MPYLHVEIDTVQTPKRADAPCGDVVKYYRTSSATTLILADGLGSGINANIAANLTASRFVELFKSGISIRKAFSSLVKSMNAIRGHHMSYTAFTIAHILNDGCTTVLTYENPQPILINSTGAFLLPVRSSMEDKAIVHEAECYLKNGEGLLLTSDGITQAGMGLNMPNGWESKGVCSFAGNEITSTRSYDGLAQKVHDQAVHYWGNTHGDDCTTVLLNCRYGKTVHLFTGPPASPYNDAAVVKKFMQNKDVKIVSGATTAKIVAKYTGKSLEVESEPISLVTPPMYMLDGVDLVTEGAITLNQLYNVMDEDPESFEDFSAVTEMYDYLQKADRVHILLGMAVNPANLGISFRQRGILHRNKIIHLLAEKLREQQKLVVLEYV